MPKRRKPKPVAEYLKPIEGVRWEKGESVDKLIKYFSELSTVKNRRKQWLEIFRQDFEETGNPLCAWDAYLLARKDDFPIPEWVLKYFDMVGIRLLKSERQAKDSAKCLGFQPGPGAGPFKEYLSHQIKRTAMAYVRNALEKDPDLSIDDACVEAVEVVKKRWGKNYDWNTIRKWYNQIDK